MPGQSNVCSSGHTTTSIFYVVSIQHTSRYALTSVVCVVLICTVLCGAVLCCAMLQINDRYEFYDELDLDHVDGKYLSPQVRRLWQAAQALLLLLLLLLLLSLSAIERYTGTIALHVQSCPFWCTCTRGGGGGGVGLFCMLNGPGCRGRQVPVTTATG
jgi:hypothetical protein